MLKIFFNQLLLVVAVLIPALTSAQALDPATSLKDYNAVARLDEYTQEQLWSEYFKLPSGVNAYATTDLAENGLTFTYENSNPDLLEVTNCGFNPNQKYRNNNITWKLKPMTVGEAVLTIHCTYNGVISTVSRKFTVTDPGDLPFTPNVSNVQNLNGLRKSDVFTTNVYLSNFFKIVPGWNDPKLWEANGITFGMTASNTDVISNIVSEISGNYAQATLTIQPVTGSGTLTAWAERNGTRVEATYNYDLYTVKATPDTYFVEIKPGQDTITFLANDKMLSPYKVELLTQPRHGTASICDAKDTFGRDTKAVVVSRTEADVQGVENYTEDTFNYRLSYVDANGQPIESSDATVTVTLRKNPGVTKVFEFVPAPGQFVNSSGFTQADVLIGSTGGNGSESVPATSGMISLGGFGGYVVLGFDQPVLNDPRNPYGVDFTIAGNAFEAAAKGYWAEPGAVMVMRDDNGNGLPDDTWYELAGSNYWFNTSRRNVTFSYEDPGYASRYYIPYTTSDGHKGAVPSNQFHAQSYFPNPAIYKDITLKDDKYLNLTGTHINAVYDLRVPSYIECYRPLGFGYCDNHATTGDLTKPRNPYYQDDNGKVADGFDISWAVDKDGNYVDLDHIDFIKIYNSVNQQCGWLGESSTEVAAIAITRPDPQQTKEGDYYLNYAGITQLQVVEGMTCQYEGIAFHNGRRMSGTTAKWSVENPSVGTIDENGLFTAIKTGATKIHFSATDLAPEDVFEVEVVTLKDIKIAREGNASTVSETAGTCLVGDKMSYVTLGITENGSTLNGTNANNFIYDTYTWTSSDPSVAAIEPDGFFEALKAGVTTLTVTSNTNPNIKKTFELTVIDIPQITQAFKYIAIEDDNLSQKELNDKVFACDQIAYASFKDTRTVFKKAADLSLVKVEPEEYSDMFYISHNTLCNNLVKGDWREYRLTIEARIGDQVKTIILPVLHTSKSNYTKDPAVNDNVNLIIDATSRTGSLDLSEVYSIDGMNDFYKLVTRKYSKSPALPEGYTVSVTNNILTVSLSDEAQIQNGLSVIVEGALQRASRTAAPSINPSNPYTYHQATVYIDMTQLGVDNISPDKTGMHIFPNPAVYSIALGNIEPIAVKIYSAGSTLVFNCTVNPGEAIDVSALPAGIYFVVLPDGPAQKLIKK
ncbi:MAG: T9SS type A sorting domain-containing protein [Muribaculaceae bacterium]|nr:T9SS type A sorting domain-containing protein [Muribaculaceae bacterium]